MVDEIWKDIENYDGLYQVSNLGRVRSLDHYGIMNGGKWFIKGRILKGRKDGSGYLCVMLCFNGKHKQFKIHRLVAQAFLPNPDNLPEIDHINRDKTDNKFENLRWVDDFVQNNNRVMPNTKPVQQYTKDGQFVAEYTSIGDASRQTGIGKSAIAHCCKNDLHYHTAGGYVWRWC